MARKRKSHTSAFKAQVALAAVKGDRTINELAHPTDLVFLRQADAMARTLGPLLKK